MPEVAWEAGEFVWEGSQIAPTGDVRVAPGWGGGQAVVFLEHGQPIVYGPKGGPKQGLRLNQRLQLEVVDLGDEVTEQAVEDQQILIHDETNPVLASLLARLRPPFPVAMGVIYRIDRPTYDAAAHAQINEAAKRPDAGDLESALRGKSNWIVE